MKAVFLDKDGTLVEDVPYNVDPERIRLMPGAAEGLFLLHASGYRLFVVSNQSGVARGYFPEEALRAVEDRLRGLLAEFAVPLDGFYYCPHHPEGGEESYAIDCDCRKPRPGLIRQAARDHGMDLSRSWVVGDILNDIEAGRRAGCRTVLVDNGNETEWLLTPWRLPHHFANDLIEAALIIAAVGGIGSRLDDGRWTMDDGRLGVGRALDLSPSSIVHRPSSASDSPSTVHRLSSQTQRGRP
jgi:histidinol-phosphate phosphatase family protein